MARCRHSSARVVDTRQLPWIEYHQCTRCHQWLSLGPAVDTPATEIEVRAARRAVEYPRWASIAISTECVLDGDGNCDHCQIEHLARVIATHDARDEGES